MALTDGDKAECKELARLIIKEVILEHIMSCPHGQKILVSKGVVFGICICCGVSGVLGGGLGLALAKSILGM